MTTAPVRSVTTGTKQTTSRRVFRRFEVSGGRSLGKGTGLTEVSGVLGGRQVRLITDQSALGLLMLEDSGTTRTLTRTELEELDVALAICARAHGYTPPVGVREARVAIAEALSGAAPMSEFRPLRVKHVPEYIAVDGLFSGSPATATLTLFPSQGAMGLTLLFQTSGPARARRMVRGELEGLIAVLAPMASKRDTTGKIYADVVAAASAQLLSYGAN